MHQAPGLSMSAAAKTLSQVMSRWACIAVTTRASNWLIQNDWNRPLESMHPMLCWRNHRDCDWSYSNMVPLGNPAPWPKWSPAVLGQAPVETYSYKCQECSRHHSLHLSKSIPICGDKSTHRLRIWELSPHDRLTICQIYAQPSAWAIAKGRGEGIQYIQLESHDCEMKWLKSNCWYCLASSHLCRIYIPRYTLHQLNLNILIPLAHMVEHHRLTLGTPNSSSGVRPECLKGDMKGFRTSNRLVQQLSKCKGSWWEGSKGQFWVTSCLKHSNHHEPNRSPPVNFTSQYNVWPWIGSNIHIFINIAIRFYLENLWLFNPKTAGPRHSISADAASLFPVGGVGTKGV